MGDSSNNTITDNTMTNDGIIFSGDSPLKYWNTQTIEGNTVNTKPLYYLKNRVGGKVPEDAGQVILANCTGMKIENLNISDTDVGVQLGFSSQNIIEYNNVLNNGDGIELYHSRNNNITDNNISINEENGIYLDDSNNITNNTISSNNKYGIYLRGSDNNNISSNDISFNFKGIFGVSASKNNINSNTITFNFNGIHFLMNCDNNNIASNNISFNGQEGILIERSDYNNITSNNISRNDEDGISITDNFPHEEYSNIISSNNIFSNGESGIYLDSAYFNVITLNNIVSNGENGIYISSSFPNTIYLNNFIDNTNNACVKSDLNEWNSDSPITYIYNGEIFESYLGNYWSDYNGSDDDGDGIGDNPYTGIDETDEDPYPLVEPIEGYSLYTVPPNTPNGTNVTVTIDPVTVTYENVTSEGTTLVTSQTGNPVTGPPSGFMFRGYFVDVSTTAEYSGAIEVCINYTGLITGDEDDLRLMHWDGSGWEGVTTSLDTTNNVICGEVSSLSWFGIASYSPPEVPLLSPIGLIALAGSLGLVALAMIRRR